MQRLDFIGAETELAENLVGMLAEVRRPRRDLARRPRQPERLTDESKPAAVGTRGLAAIGNPVTYAHHKWDQFRNLNESTTTASTRLLTTSGQPIGITAKVCTSDGMPRAAFHSRSSIRCQMVRLAPRPSVRRARISCSNWPVHSRNTPSGRRASRG